MGQIFVLAEHRRGEIRDIAWEMLSRGRALAEQSGTELTAVLLGYQVGSFARELACRADRVLVVDDAKLRDFNGEVYQAVLTRLTAEYQPVLTMVGHTAYGMELVGRLDVPVATDCVDLRFEDGALKAVRQMYSGKVNAAVSFPGAQRYMVTVRPGSFPAGETDRAPGRIETLNLPVEEPRYRSFVEYIVEPEGEVDITRADILVSVGQGIRDRKNIPMIAELAGLMGGVLSCSRPIVDKRWLPKERQVGISGKAVKPKVYLAIGISGAFQHINEIRGGSIVAINKDPNAPIFRVADYGIVADLFQVVPALTTRLRQRRAARSAAV